MIASPATTASPHLSSHVEAFASHGFTVVRSLFSLTTAARMREHFMALRAEGPKPGDAGGDEKNPNDPLNRFPRMINMHDWDQATAEWSSDPRLLEAAGACIGQRTVLNQTMLYFKPPGARGQALHQDQQYITKDPLIGAWCALDRCDRDNGQMIVIPDSHRHGLLPVVKADISTSFTGGGTVVPAGSIEHGVDMEPGDVLFFSGLIIHGSHPNRTTDRFRRGFITHYVGEHATSFTPPAGHHMTHLAP
jgi:phytanoyl-CoA hydroxylase